MVLAAVVAGAAAGLQASVLVMEWADEHGQLPVAVALLLQPAVAFLVDLA